MYDYFANQLQIGLANGQNYIAFCYVILINISLRMWLRYGSQLSQHLRRWTIYLYVMMWIFYASYDSEVCKKFIFIKSEGCIVIKNSL